MAPRGANWNEGTQELRVWLRLLSCTNFVAQHLRRNMKDTFAVTLPRFDLLAQVARPPLGPTLSELSRRLLVTKGNITDIVIRLEKERLVERRQDETDGRIQHVFLTDTGEAMLEDMLAAHNRWLQDLMQHMSAKEMTALNDALGVLREALKQADERLADAAGMDEDLTAGAASATG